MKNLFYLFGTLLIGIGMLTSCSNPGNQQQAAASVETSSDEEVFQELEEKYQANLGLYAIDTGSGEIVAYHENERFAFASTHKALSAALLLQQKSMEELNETITFGEEDLVNYNPITENHLDTGMTLLELSEASISYSDNTAANLIFEEIGGPEGFKQGLRAIGDQVTEPERIEPELNFVEPGETSDTSTPKAMAESLQTFALEDTLADEKRQLLVDWLKGNTTGDTLIRAGVPDDWEVGDKSGAGSYGTRNDIAILWPPKEAPIVLTVMSDHDQEDAESDDALIAEAAEAVVNILSSNE